MHTLNREEKTAEQLKIDKDCGCSCHKENTITQNYFWCGNCPENHKKDSRYPIKN